MRKESGGDLHRKCLNLHNGVNITNEFLKAVSCDEEWRLIDPKTKQPVKIINARHLKMANIKKKKRNWRTLHD
jgi:Ribonucleotide reductase, barrel domain.